MVICLEQGADLHMAQLMPLPLIVSCFSKIQIGFTFLVPAQPGSPGQRAVKWVCVCVCVRACVLLCLLAEYLTLSTDRELISWLWVNSDESKTSCETKPESCDEILDSCRTQEDSCKHKNTGNVVSELCSVLQLLLKQARILVAGNKSTKSGNILFLKCKHYNKMCMQYCDSREQPVFRKFSQILQLLANKSGGSVYREQGNYPI